MKLFPKLSLTVSGLLAGTTMALCGTFYLAESRTFRAEAEKERRALVQNVAHIARESFLTNDDLLLVKYTRWIQKWNPAITSLSVVSPRGEILAHSEPHQIGSVLPPRSGLSSERSSASEHDGRNAILVLTQAVHLGGQCVANVSAGFSEEKLQALMGARLAGLQERLELIALGAVAIGVLVSFGLARSWTRPIEALAQASGHVGKGIYQIEPLQATLRADELGLLSRSFQSMANDLQQLDAMKEDFVSAVTHELRSPLSAMESFLNLMDEEVREGTNQESWPLYIGRLQANAQRLTRFVNDLLDVAALERGKMVLDCQAFALDELVQEVLSFYAPKLDERSLLARVRVPRGALPKAWADSNKVRQVLINLLSNAIKFTPDGGMIELGLEHLPKEGQLCVWVKDSGLGISPEDQKKIFDKFEQVKSARAAVKGPKGTGLGLAICRLLIEEHRGTLRVASRPGEGSCFSFTLPAITSLESAPHDDSRRRV